MSKHNRDGSNPSFVERDKLRRERKHGGDRTRAERGTGTHAQQDYRAALERAFDEGRLAEFAATMQRTREAQIGLGKGGQARPAAEEQPAIDARLAPPAPAPGAADPTAVPGAPVTASPEVAERRKLAKQIVDAESRLALDKALRRYVERYGELPKDAEILERALGHQDARIVIHALERLDAWVRKDKPRRSRSLSVALSIVEDTHDDNEIRALAARVRAAL